MRVDIHYPGVKHAPGRHPLADIFQHPHHNDAGGEAVCHCLGRGAVESSLSNGTSATC